MSNDSTNTGVQTRPWRVVIHDPAAEDPKLLLATVIDVEPAWPRVNPAAVTDATRWAAERIGDDTVRLVPVPGATVWAVDAG